MSFKTKIVATIGPASRDKDTLEKLVQAGMNVARLNFSHGAYEEHSEAIRTIRSLSRVHKRSIAILLDLQGPKLRIGKLENGKPVELSAGDDFCITTHACTGTAKKVSTSYPNLAKDVQPGDRILLDDGLIRLQVESVDGTDIHCRVKIGGFLKEKKGINLPGVSVSEPCLSVKDKRDINFGIKNKVDYFALSFVRTAEDIVTIKEVLNRQGSTIPVVAKIEKPEAVQNLESILKVTDAIMVARGDLGVELNPELVPTIQKQIIQTAMGMSVPVITATQMLETMSQNPIPTRAEASDVANAIFDGTDAVMLSAETASGLYPVTAVEMMAKIARNTETSPFMRYNIQYPPDVSDPITHAVAQSAVNILHEIDAKCIVAFSVSGRSSQLISKQRPSKPVYAFSSREETFNQLSLMWGVTPMYIPRIDNVQRLLDGSERILLEKGCVEMGDLIVLVIGMGLTSGSTNSIKIHRVGSQD